MFFEADAFVLGDVGECFFESRPALACGHGKVVVCGRVRGVAVLAFAAVAFKRE